VSTVLAHIGGIPVEEGLLTIAPAVCVFAVLVRARLEGVVQRLRQRVGPATVATRAGDRRRRGSPSNAVIGGSSGAGTAGEGSSCT
jgi:hypothetical protein